MEAHAHPHSMDTHMISRTLTHTPRDSYPQLDTHLNKSTHSHVHTHPLSHSHRHTIFISYFCFPNFGLEEELTPHDCCRCRCRCRCCCHGYLHRGALSAAQQLNMERLLRRRRKRRKRLMPYLSNLLGPSFLIHEKKMKLPFSCNLDSSCCCWSLSWALAIALLSRKDCSELRYF